MKPTVVDAPVSTPPAALNAVPTGAKVTVAVIVPGVSGSVAVPAPNVVQENVIVS